jgi:hypothetical protein
MKTTAENRCAGEGKGREEKYSGSLCPIYVDICDKLAISVESAYYLNNPFCFKFYFMM